MATEREYIEGNGNSNMKGFLIGMLVGAVVGSAAALLLAPKSGKETREMIRNKASETQEMLRSRVNEVKERVGKIRDCVSSNSES